MTTVKKTTSKKTTAKTKKCDSCGASLRANDKYCPACGASVSGKDEVVHLELIAGPKSRIAAGLLAFFLGSLGIHNFYLGYNGRAITQLLLTTIGGLFTCGVTTFIVQIWAMIEGVLILSGAEGYNKDAQGEALTA